MILTQAILVFHTVMRTKEHFQHKQGKELVNLLIIDGVYLLYTLYYVLFLTQQCKLKEANLRVVRIWFKTVISVNEEDDG